MLQPRAALAASLAAAAGLAPVGASGHGVRHELWVEEGTVAVRVLDHGGRPLADARWEALAPAEPRRPAPSGRTDRHGWLVFAPDAAGTWRVKVADDTGHGAVVEVTVPEAALARVVAAAPAGGGASPPPGRDSPEPAPRRGDGGDPDGGAPGPLRVLAGAAALVLAFLALFAVQRRRRAAGR